LHTIPTIQASADPDFLTPRIERIKKSFGLPAWLTGLFKKPLPLKTDDDRFNPMSPTYVFRGSLEEFFTDGQDALAPTIREQEVVAHVAVAELSLPTAPTTKSRILDWFEGVGFAHISHIQAAFPDVAKNGISSRVSELVKAGQLVALGLGNYELPPIKN